MLVTARADIVTYDPAAGGRLMTPFTEQEGAEFLEEMLGRGHYTTSETQSARQLSLQLGGLPLALNLMGTQIKRRGRQIEQFLKLYEKNAIGVLHSKQGTPNKYYSQDLATVWQTTFRPLTEDSLALMCVLSLMAPDNVPESLFTLPSNKDIPASLSFCADPLRYVDSRRLCSESVGSDRKIQSRRRYGFAACKRSYPS